MGSWCPARRTHGGNYRLLHWSQRRSSSGVVFSVLPRCTYVLLADRYSAPRCCLSMRVSATKSVQSIHTSSAQQPCPSFAFETATNTPSTRIYTWPSLCIPAVAPLPVLRSTYDIYTKKTPLLYTTLSITLPHNYITHQQRAGLAHQNAATMSRTTAHPPATAIATATAGLRPADLSPSSSSNNSSNCCSRYQCGYPVASAG